MNDEEPISIDPVCGMKLDEKQVRESLVYKGGTFYFCSVGCLSEFRRHPDDYLDAAQGDDT